MKQVFNKVLGNYYKMMAMHYRQMQTRYYSVMHPYHYDAKRYEGTFLEELCDYEYTDEPVKNIDRVIYIFWTGNNEIPPNRLVGIKSLEKVSGVEVKLITPQSLRDYIKEDDPLPEAYKYLSFVHRADYLRTYFMYHHGGGYADIKPATASWVNAFAKLEQSEAYAIGYPEVGFYGVANQDVQNANLKRDTTIYWRYMIGNCAYICRPYTPFTAEWYCETKKRVVNFTEQLKMHPAIDPFGRNNGYPIPWSFILGQVFHPLCLKYHDKLLQDKSLLPVFHDYR